MNLVILYGIVVTNVDFRFIYDRFCCDARDIEKYNHISVASCRLRLLNDSIIEIYGYDNVADLMLRNLKINDKIFVEGKIDNDGKIEVKEQKT